ncbi:restriction endonuclease [Amycolatopsis sp. H20-H5]|uniref:restriction endonuclease n=1 Tax=Amycolatopsis sp. H20-H5 TaxID=3046309 RepID=UPI002DBBD6C0|nr:restriction endonuclease [Amycolatopsis sp. H20-H5]MEC3977332.1 restriction endonuclease [Amycolatopsis sp. H20-H5]
MARRTGVFVQMQREAARRQRDRQRAQIAYARLQAQTQREADRAERETLRTAAATLRLSEQHAKADARAQAEAVKQQKQAHVELQQARVARQNADLDAAVADLEQLLSATLEVDDFIDFISLNRVAEHPPFTPGTLANAIPTPAFHTAHPEPTLAQFTPPEPAGMAKIFGGKAKYAQELARAQQQYAQTHFAWQQHVAAVQQGNSTTALEYRRAEQRRTEALRTAKHSYDQECATREAEVAEHNAEVQALADAFGRREPQATLEYFTLVLANSDYPEGFPQQYRLAYVPESTQLVVEYELPSLECVPDVREFKYIKSKDEITSTARAARDIKALYASVVAQLTLRTLHEIFEADRTRLVETVVFNGLVTTTDPGTGKEIRPCLVTVRTTREVFDDLDLALVEPLACLERLNAAVSKRPSELAPVRPVLEFDMVDKRFIEETDVLSGLDQRPNLLELTPTEFESLIQNLFTTMGLDTKQTRASRDGGVDCVAFDPLELIDGSNLLYLLAEHAGIEAKIMPPEGS